MVIDVHSKMIMDQLHSSILNTIKVILNEARPRHIWDRDYYRHHHHSIYYDSKSNNNHAIVDDKHSDHENSVSVLNLPLSTSSESFQISSTCPYFTKAIRIQNSSDMIDFPTEQQLPNNKEVGRYQRHIEFLQSKITKQNLATYFEYIIVWYVFVVVTITVITRRFSMLHGVTLLLLSVTCWYVLKWILYILDDPELMSAIGYIQSYYQIFMEESSKILAPDNQRQNIFKFAILQQSVNMSSMGLDFIQWFVYVKSQESHEIFLQEITSRRYQPTTKNDKIDES